MTVTMQRSAGGQALAKFLVALGLLASLACEPLFAQAPLSASSHESPSPNEQAAPRAPEVIAEHAQRALNAGNYAIAEKDYQQLLKLGIRSAPLYSNLSVLYMRTGRFDQAIGALLKAKELAPGVAGIRLNLGLAHFRKHEFKSAATYFGEALVLDPGNAQAHYLKGICDFMLDSFPAAIADFEAIQADEQNDLEYLFMLGTSYGMVKRKEDSLRIFQRMIAAGGDTPHLHLLLGKAYLAFGQGDNAAVELDRAIKNGSLPFAHYYLGVLQRQRGQLDMASVEFEQELEIAPDNISAYKDLAEIHLEQDKVQDAILVLRKGIARNPEAADLFATLGRAYLQISDQAQAIAVLNRATRIDPDVSSFHYQLGRAYLKAGLRQAATAEMSRARALANEAPEGKIEAISKDQGAHLLAGEAR